MAHLTVHKTFSGEEMFGMTRPLHNIPEKMVQRENESVSHFLGRIQDMANKLILEAKIEDKFDIGDEKLGFDVGKIERGKRRKEKRKLFKNKQKERKRRKLEDANESLLVKEHIPFGETTMAPPVLIALKKGKQKLNAGMRNLLLKSLTKIEDPNKEQRNHKKRRQ